MRKILVVLSIMMLLCSATAALAAAPIKIGGLFAVTGPAAFLGEPEKNTLELLVKEANAKGGIGGSKIELVIYDTGGDVTKAVQLANKLIKNDKVSAIVGPSTTGETMAVIPIAEKEQIPLVSCAAGIKITDPVKKWVFKTPANDHVAAEKILLQASKLKQKNIALLTVSDSFGSSGREQLKQMAAKHGFKVVADEVYGPKDTDMTAQLTKIKAAKPDAIICWGTNPGPAIITRNVQQLGIKAQLYQSHGVASKKYIELASAQAAQGVMLPAGKLAVFDLLKKTDPQAKLLKEYNDSYKKAYGIEASTFGGYAYDGFQLIAAAVKNGAVTPAQIRDGIEKGGSMVGVSGVFKMTPKDHNGLDLSAFEMVRIDKGDWAIVR
ncbi:branched-chain amino acid ABC transporter, periplasmic amino acid-binding protein, putative [Citrifermentans bemidjiense Bem]|uniref:Branched-chain amino acid ABC transporter, periplasmic amino acid-binding protein, putative n=1 Tax=Citrifermentans bemidjiense (strain ATCC BAA-1014 / DSM 16622 / JCM 12645 / Bem) TaxID=404380 RepID=B5EDK6_CITBB|nr:ABC transporter substrate-binding protein [Citrifermentans bemidjiense]ACH39202.1 branched-chain amino acid ABC transporter, periplasmic amino acid-binding protein, putative [Citrifermentans bemidjiense Bem]